MGKRIILLSSVLVLLSELIGIPVIRDGQSLLFIICTGFIILAWPRKNIEKL